MALDPSEFYHYENPSDEADSSSELDDEHDYSESEGEALEVGVTESNDDVLRWCREEQFEAGASGASTRKRKKLASSQKSPPPPKHGRKSGDERGENDLQEMKHLLQKLCKKVEKKMKDI